MNYIFLPMFLGHVIADFWLQPSSWVNDKIEKGYKSKKLLWHAVIASLLPTLLTFDLRYWWFFPIILVSHFIIDWLKSRHTETLTLFLSDQFLHIGIIVLLSQLISEQLISSQNSYYWMVALGAVLATNPSSIFIGIFLNQLIKSDTINNKLDISAWIGIIERLLIVAFILVDEFQAIGFLIAAKSIFRFNEAKKDDNKKAEYFLLGTFVSFAIAIGIGLGIRLLN